MNNLKRAAVVAIVCLLGIGGCKSNEPVLPPQVKENPNPLTGYKVIMTIKNPPGQMRATGDVTYAIVNNRDCIPLDRTLALGGIHPSFDRTIAVPVSALGNNQYELTFYDDAFKSQNYYGRGLCHWRGSAGFTLHWEEYSARASAQSRRVNETVALACTTEPSNPTTACVGIEHIKNKSVQRFLLEMMTTRTK